MKWYAGGIAEAVAASKTKGAIFVIYIEGKDEKSQHISTLLELPDVESMLGGDNFVAIKVEADSVPHQQFSALYKQTPVPSIYFIGKNGSPLKIVTEASDSGTLITQLDDVLVKSGINTSNSAVSQSFIDTEQSSSAKPDNVVCENGVCTIKKDTQPSAPSTSTEGEGSAPTTEEKIEKAKQLLEAKRLEKEKEEKEATPGPSVNRSDPRTAVLQFKLPDGSTKTQDFASTDKLQSVLNYLKSELKLPLNKFTLSTTFPRRQFAEKDYNDTLTDLNLTPNAVILVLPINNGTVSTNTGQGGLFGFVWTLLTPLLGILNFIKAFLGFGSPGTAGGDGSAPSTSGGYSGGSRANSVIHIRSKYDLDNRLKAAGTKLVVIDFFATWCGPCKMIAPELDRMAKEFSNVLFLKVDVDQNGDISREYSVSAMPTFVFVKNRREVTRFQGADSYQLRSTIQRYR
ncbi:UBX domain-containing protein 4-like isoform X3 [Rhynchophorus ferrugineus]|uniref:UBX domain-containing protein 4-like isoform X3 n=1 Tax=Rhynchophorus ferrugineus TaxID=354439 RepID=UPI003FCE3609